MAAWGLSAAAWTSAHTSVPRWGGRVWIHSSKVSFLRCTFIFVHRSAPRFTSPLSHYWISGLPKYLAHWRCAKWSCKKDIELIYKTRRYWEVKVTAQGHTENVCQCLKPGPQNSILVSRNQGVRTSSCHWIIGRLPWGSKSKVPCTIQTEPGRQKNQTPSQTKLVALARQVFPIFYL